MYGSSAEPPSSMVTLNLRNATQNDSSLSPPSPSPVAQPAATENAADAINDQVKESVEEYEVEMGPAPFQGPDTPRSSSLHSPSPPIEVITEQSDEDMILDRQSIGVSIVEDDLVLVDPIHEFPFKEHNESLEGMVTRLSSYLTNRKSCLTFLGLPEMLTV
jgi:ubiquitin carboxyl-terminal hydrolase 34